MTNFVVLQLYTCVPKISQLTALSTPFWSLPPPYAYRWRFVGMMARVSERNSRARETGGLSIARRWSAPCVSMVRVTPRKEKNKE